MLIFAVKPSPQKWSYPLKTVFCNYLEKYRLFQKKLFNGKIFKILFLIKKITYIFAVGLLFSSKMVVAPKWFFAKNTALFKKIV